MEILLNELLYENTPLPCIGLPLIKLIGIGVE